MGPQRDRIHFEDYPGQEFERLCCAYLVRKPEYTEVDWYGQVGGDRGRDIVCKAQDGSTIVCQCVNQRRLTTAKVRKDLGKIARGPRCGDVHVWFITGSAVSAAMKDRVSSVAAGFGFQGARVWSGLEFSERLHADAPDLLARFAKGQPFPDRPDQLAAFAADSASLSDDEIVRALAHAFDRPAYRTPFRHEASLPRFSEAIAETINTINTGRTPSGVLLPSKHRVRQAAKRRALDELVEELAGLRAAFCEFLRRGEIQAFNPDLEHPQLYNMTDHAIHEMDSRRRRILRKVKELNSQFDDSFYDIP